MTNADDKGKWNAYVQCLLRSFRDLPDSNQGWTVPFVPWCGEEYWDAKARILFVGKSVGAFNDPADAKEWQTPFDVWKEQGSPDTTALTSKYVKSKVAIFGPASHAFWTVPLLIAAAFISPDASPDRLAGSLAWSNVYKVNNLRSPNGLPSTKDLKCRCDDRRFCLSHSSLRGLGREIEILRPDFVLLGVTHEWKKLAKALSIPLEGGDRQFPLKLTDSEIGRMIEPVKLSCAPKGIWLTYHFSAWGQNCKHARTLLEMRRAFDE